MPALLSEKRPLIGFLQTRRNPEVTELTGICGYDFVLMDCEHGILSESDCVETAAILTAGGVLALVRLADHDRKAVGKFLDMGIDAVVIPNVSTAAQATMLARAAQYPPSGTRSFGASLHRVTRYGIAPAETETAPQSKPRLLVMIESTLGVNNVEEIIAVDGVDGVVVGPWDLTADLGRLGDFSQPGYVEALDRVERAVNSVGKLLGTAPHPGSPAEALVARGHRLLIIGADIPLFREAMTSQVLEARSAIRTQEKT